MELSDIVWEVKKETTKRMVASGKRSDGRRPDEYRKLHLVPDYVPRAEGSCLGKLGDTTVMVGVKLDIGEPYPDSPDRGTLITNAELVPLASPTFEAGPPSEKAIEIARVVDRGLRESQMIDFNALCVTPGEEVWTVLVDIHVLDHAGNLIDAASMAAVKALHMARFPKYEDKKVIYGEKTTPLPIKDAPVSSTFSKVGNVTLLDPTIEEEKAMDCQLTMVTNQAESLCAMQKSGPGAFTSQEIDRMLDIAIERGREIRKELL